MQGSLVHVILISRISKEVQTMNTNFYKMRRNRMVSGVLAGLSDKWNLDVTLVRFLFVIFTIANFGLGIIIYIILAYILPTKEDIEAEMYGTGPRKIKEAQPINDDEGWFW
jgi:stress-responsive transcriptional regulator